MSYNRIKDKHQAMLLIEELVKKFDKEKDVYLSNKYREEDTRSEFIDRFFEALGWDMSNANARRNDKKEVFREPSEEDEDSKTKKYPDYAFNQSGGHTVFYVEAKKPCVDIINEKSPAYQIRKYGWNKNLDVSLLTNFENIIVYNTTVQPKKNDSALTKRIEILNYKDYVKNIDKLWNNFSWEAVNGTGTFDDYVASNINRKSKGTEVIDNKLLDTISKWREWLAESISKDNQNLTKVQINLSVQRIIDRLIFLRIAEDKQIEEYEKLLRLTKSDNTYKALIKFFYNINEKYNSGLFKIEKWIDDLVVDSKLLNKIIVSMYVDGDCPYEWSILPIDILGNIYEKFLGSEIEISSYAGKQKAKIVEKTRVNKETGVFYTPKYIVDYIVKETVGKKIDEIQSKYSKQFKRMIDAVDGLKILDMACGSGSFLINAYNYLLNWYLEKYSSKKDDYLKNKVLVKTNNGIQLSIEEKQRILLNNIYGVDIDYQAIEVTKLSLFLQMLDKQGKLVDDSGTVNMFMVTEGAILPNLSNNIKCGNSVVDNSIYNFQEYTSEEKNKINAFDWEIQFKKIMDAGGFDIILGNPPYITEDVSREIFNPLKNNECYLGKMDFWYFFGIKALNLLREKGVVGFIATGNWNSNDGAKKFRNLVLQKGKILRYIDFADYMVFDKASIQTMIYIMEKCNVEHYTFPYYKIKDNKSKSEVLDLLKDYSTSKILKTIEIDREKLTNNIISFVDANSDDFNILNKIKQNGSIYLESCDMTEGIVPAPDKYFVITDISKYRKSELKFIKQYQTGLKDRYSQDKSNEYIIYLAPHNFGDKNIKDYPNINKHFLQYKKELKQSKEKYGSPNKEYYYVNRPRDEKFFIEGNEKIIVQGRCQRPTCYYTKEEFYGSRALYFIQTSKIDMKYLTAILNSDLIYYWIKHFGKLQGNTLRMEIGPLKNIPIAKTTDDNIKEIGKLVDRISMLKTKELNDVVKNEILNVDLQINNLIYKIYNLTSQEINIIEESI